MKRSAEYKSYKVRLTVAYGLCLLSIIFSLLVCYKAGILTRVMNVFIEKAPFDYTENVQYEQRNSFFEVVPSTKADILFLGDSITANCEWQELIPDKTVLNRGIGSDTTEGVLNRLDTVIKNRPDSVFVMLGINDIGKGISEAIILENYQQIISKLKSELPDASLYVQSILPVISGGGG